MTLLAVTILSVPMAWSQEMVGWPHYGGDAAGTRHSTAKQITPENAQKLEVAWRFSTGEVALGEDLPAGGDACSVLALPRV